MSLFLRRLIYWFNLFDSKVQALTNCQSFRKLIYTRTHDSLCCPGNHFQHLCRRDCHYRDIILDHVFQSGSRGVLLYEDEIWTESFYLLHNDFHQRFLLVNLCLHIDRTVIVFLNISEIIIDDKDFWHFNLGAHTTTRNILFEDHAVHILAFLLVSVLNRYNLDKRVEIY